MKRVELAYGLSCQVRPLKQAMKMSSRHKQTFFWTESEGLSGGRPRASPPAPPSQAAPGHTGPLCSVRGPQWGPPLPSRSSQCSGETLRPTRSMQWRTSEQDAKSATRGFSGWGGGAVLRGRGRAAGMRPMSPRPWGRGRPLGRTGGVDCWFGDHTPLCHNNSGRLFPSPRSAVHMAARDGHMGPRGDSPSASPAQGLPCPPSGTPDGGEQHRVPGCLFLKEHQPPLCDHGTRAGPWAPVPSVSLPLAPTPASQSPLCRLSHPSGEPLRLKPGVLGPHGTLAQTGAGRRTPPASIRAPRSQAVSGSGPCHPRPRAQSLRTDAEKAP